MVKDEQNPQQDLDRIREILFGEQRRALEARIAELEAYVKRLEARHEDLAEAVATDSALLRKEHAKREELSGLFTEVARRLSPASSRAGAGDGA